MAPSPISSDPPEDEAERVRAENERLRQENLRLRAAVCAARPETPENFTVPSTPAAGGALGAADRLVHLMQEGGHLLKEREALRLENEALESELEALEGEEGLAGADGEGIRDPEVDEDVGDQDADDLVTLRLLPLLSEGDALRTERETLRAERKDLLNELEAAGAPDACDEAAMGELTAGDQELEGRFLGAVQEVSRENANLEAEIKQLRDQNTRLRSKAAKAEVEETKAINTDSYVPKQESRAPKPAPEKSVAARAVSRPQSGVKHFGKAPPKPQQDFDAGLEFQQREAMASLLRKSQEVTSPSTARSNQTARGMSPSPGKGEMDKLQEEQIKGALHTLFANFGK